MTEDTREKDALAKLTASQRETFQRLKERLAEKGMMLALSDDGKKLIYLRADGSEITRGPISNLNA